MSTHEDEIAAGGAILRDVTSGHSAEIAGILTSCLPELPRVAKSFVARAAKSPSLTGERKQSDLHDALAILRLLGFWNETLPIVQMIADMPYKQQFLFQLPRGIVHEARWHALRSGDTNVAASLSRTVFDPSGFVPVDLDDDSKVFFRPLDDPRMRASLGLNATTDSTQYVLPPTQRPGFFLRDLFYLSLIWAYGGSPVWPLDRVEAERERLEAGILALPGMAP
ncbi:hypothetical protein [Frondihabitans australicus]|nr:hypothetical protein [Frondihabitans australicus]